MEVEVEHRRDNDEQHVNAKMAVEWIRQQSRAQHSAGYANSQTTVALFQLPLPLLPPPLRHTAFDLVAWPPFGGITIPIGIQIVLNELV